MSHSMQMFTDDPFGYVKVYNHYFVCILLLILTLFLNFSLISAIVFEKLYMISADWTVYLI
jgi:hypothetical protein